MNTLTIYNIIGAERIEKVGDFAHLCGTVNWGFYTNVEVAREVVMKNMTDLHECCYEYVVIEAQEEGIAMHVPNSMEFFKFDPVTETYSPIDIPDGFAHTCGLNM